MESLKSSQRTGKESEGYLSYLAHEIHTVIAATADDEGRPVTCAIDIMDADKDSLCFLTARGKGFYHRLKRTHFIALTGIRGADTMSSIAISIRGRAEEAGQEVLETLLQKNRYMYRIYPSEESRKALAAFRITEGTGEYFDLSVRPIVRESFSFGGLLRAERMEITDRCTGCGLCITACPQQCIITNPFRIMSQNCLMCGRCLDICPEGAVIRREDNDA